MVIENNYTCDVCGEKLPSGIFGIMKHHEEKHGLRETTNAFIKARELKGSALTVEDLDKFTK